MVSKAEYWRNPEKYRALANAYRLENPEWKKKSNREWAAKKRKSNPDFVEREKRAGRKYRKANQKICQERTNDWARRHPGIWLYFNAKGRAKRFGLPFDIEKTDIVIPEFCPVLGIKIEARHDGRKGFWDASPSVDRIIPSKGYVKGNILVISNRANRLKSDGTLEEHRLLVAYLERELC